MGEVVDCDCARAEPAATSTVAGMAITVANRTVEIILMTVEIILMMEMCVAGGRSGTAARLNLRAAG